MAAKDPMIVGIGRSSRRRRIRSCTSPAGSSARPMNWSGQRRPRSSISRAASGRSRTSGSSP